MPKDKKSKKSQGASKKSQGVKKTSKKTKTKKKENFKKTTKEIFDFPDVTYEDKDFLKYVPTNEQEERDLLIAKLIFEKENLIESLLQKADSAKFEIERLGIEKEIEYKIVKIKNEDQFESRFSEDYLMIVESKLQAIEDDIAHWSLWISEAEKMIGAEKYKNVPGWFFDSFHFEGEEGSFWEEDYSECDCQACEAERGCCEDDEMFDENIF
jgi:hypothetical protein